jgi:predicted regulator of Ras-like GTPase activity (Roadblock/LC7/MglB family)
MLDHILFIAPETPLTTTLKLSLSAEGYAVTQVATPVAAAAVLSAEEVSLIIVDASHASLSRLNAEGDGWCHPALFLVEEGATLDPDPTRLVSDQVDASILTMPFSFQDLLLIIQDTVYQEIQQGRRPFQLSPELADKITTILGKLHRDLHARCVVLSSSGGRLITSVGGIDRGTAITLAALMSGSFTASAKAAQLFGDEEMFDSSLQESEGYGLYAIRLHDSLILSVAFSDAVTAGMVRHYAAQGAIDILELLVGEEEAAQSLRDLELSANFRRDVNQVLGDMLGE